MKLYQQMLVNILSGEKISFAGLRRLERKIVRDRCYRALKKIKAIVEDDSLDDFECVEKIVCVFESMGSGCGSRHDFG